MPQYPVVSLLIESNTLDWAAMRKRHEYNSAVAQGLPADPAILEVAAGIQAESNAKMAEAVVILDASASNPEELCNFQADALTRCAASNDHNLRQHILPGVIILRARIDAFVENLPPMTLR